MSPASPGGPVPPDAAWLPAVARWGGGPATVVGRSELAGGYVAGAVARIDLDVPGRAVTVVLKRASAVEVAAMRALAVVRGLDRPRMLATGRDEHGDWLVLPFYAGAPLAEGPAVPDELWTGLARVHAHWLGKRPRGLPVVDAAWWRALCLERILSAVREAQRRTGDPVFADAVSAVTAWAEDPRLLAALAVLPRTVVHGDAHRGNVLLGPEGATLIDWGNARAAPAGLDLAVLRAQGATDLSPYRRMVAELTRGGPRAELIEVERCWADAAVHVGYLGFAADHLGAARVAEMLDVVEQALAGLGPALAAVPAAGRAR
ncbi:aminoglycoside phosphotransferase family protein [Pseudonocardia acidicola]|uniref:Aminoglycoside phosphotransferase family protein n=1 Tax=Pseudonocardia acidicola TaxID=2724939 RepID=A0ABX1SIH0_9PSEU|nr:aminoglycoside phosphotransferase family protein [Pseudonocardia acidicola]NMI01381.1 aminoglycoside phosphotransferase family protein [Pseudonocardia acidicola]